MYLWKTWHDSRSRVLMYLIAGAVIGILFGMFIWADSQWILRWSVLRPKTYRPDVAVQVVRSNFAMLQVFFSMVALWASLAMGSSTIGQEYGEGTMGFVVSRPVARWRIVATEWLLHLAVIAVTLSVLIIGILPAMNKIASRQTFFELLGLLPTALIASVSVYGVVYVLTLLTGSGARGLTYTIGVILFVGLLPGALKELWHVESLAKAQEWLSAIFNWRNRFGPMVGGADAPAIFPLRQAALLLFIAAAMLSFSMLYFERKEV